VDTQTRHALKKDKLAQAAATSASWVSGHRSSVLRWVVSGGVVLLVVIAASIFWEVRTSAANLALGQAMDVYNTPLAEPGAPPQPNVYTTAEARAKEANREFVAIAQNFRAWPEAANARYFAGVTYEDLGRNTEAEAELKAAAGASNRNLANLAKLALAGLYRQTSRDQQAIDLYNAITAKPSETVSSGVAELDLADLYSAEGKQEQARMLWAKIRDADKDGAAGTAAAQKLSAKR
jgi:tetratricopeptide (TPR) repeat protein